MKAFKKILAALLALALLISPFSLLCALAWWLPDPFEKSFVGALDDKYDRLCETEGEKIVLIGGSSVAFGIRSDIIEQYTDMPVVNFGLYAALGTKLMLDLSRDAVGEGDVVIVMPELDAQTLSLYFNAPLTLRAVGKRADIFAALSASDKIRVLSSLWDYTAEKLDYYIRALTDVTAGRLDPEGVYNSDNFNAYGDLTYERSENIMPRYYDTNNMINPSVDILSDEFVDYLNDYTAYCESRGATVYFGFCPMNEWGFAEGAGIAELSAFAEYLSGVLDCEILGDPQRSVLGAGYFYDTNFHLGDAGAVKFTAELTEDILFALDSPRAVTVEIPDEPPLPEFDSYLDIYDENEKYFTFTELSDGSYAISGLSALGKGAELLTVPVAYNSRRVTVIAGGALSGISASKLVITESTSLHTISDGAFSGAASLAELWIYYPDEEKILPPSDFSGVGDGFAVYIPENSTYATGYYWGERGLSFEYIPK